MDEHKLPLLHARFDQREGTPNSQLRPSPDVRHLPCDCLSLFRIHESEEAQELLRAAGEGGTTEVLRISNSEKWRELERAAEATGWREVHLHADSQDRNCEAWSALEDYIAVVAKKGRDEFNPMRGIGPVFWRQIVTLPPSIAKLQSVKYFALYGSPLVRIPPEIGELKNLEEFDPYTSYRLHWFPYEITRCPKLTRSRVSTRALYGNYKFRPPFPRLPADFPEVVPSSCSVCNGRFDSGKVIQIWISQRVATDVLPLLVHACSAECVEKLPKPPEGYVQLPHQGGLELEQPPTRF